MKKILLFAFALAGLFFAAACQQENLEPVGSNTVTYTVQVPDALATKALGDEIAAVNELVYEVYRTEDERVDAFTNADNLLYHKTATITNGVATITLELINNQNFTVLFWAHTKDNGVYNADDLTEVTITSPDVANNVNAQAFVGRDYVVNCVSDAAGKVTLTRPVSQLNLGTTVASLTAFEDPITISGSSVTVKGLSTSYNVAALSAGEVAEEAYVYTETACPDATLTVGTTQYAYVAMNYIGFADQNGSSVDVDFTINTSEGDVPHTVANVPVKPNYKTNIVGNLLTAETVYNVTLESEWAGSSDIELIHADTAEEFAQGVTVENAQVILPENTTYALPATIAEGVTIVGSEGSVIDFSGKNCSSLNNVTFKNIIIKEDNEGYNGIQHSESVSYVDCTIDGALWSYADEATFIRCTFKNETDNYALWIYSSAKVVLNECTFETSLNKGVLIYNEATREFDVTLEGCTFNADECKKNKAAVQLHTEGGIYGTLVINDCTAPNFFDQSGRGVLWSEVMNNTDPETPSNKFNVTVDGVSVARAGYTQLAQYPNLWTKDGEYFVFDVEGLEALHSFFSQRYQNPFDKVFNIAADIDAEDYTWASIWLETGNNNMGGSVINGNGHTISNLTITGGAMFNGTPNGRSSDVPMTIKDLTIDKADVTAGAHFNAVFWGSTYGDVAFENVMVKNSAIEGNCNVGAFVGGTSLDKAEDTAKISFKNCELTETALTATGASNPDPTGASGFIGRAFANTSLEFFGENRVDATITNNNGLVGGKVYGYTTYLDGFVGTGSCDTFTNFGGVQVVMIGTAIYNTIEDAIAAANAGDVIKLITDVTPSETIITPANITIDGNGKQINGTINAGGNLTFAGHTKVTSFSASYYDRVITIGEGACLEITGTGRVSLAYRNTFNITGNLTDAKTADRTEIQPSLIIPEGISITGGSNATMNITNAYVKIGSTTSKNSAANGVFTLNITNSIAEFTTNLIFAAPTNGMEPTFNLNITNSVMTTGAKLAAVATNTNVSLKNSHVKVGTYLRNSGNFELTDGSELISGSLNFGEHGGHDGITIVDASSLKISTSNNPAYALDGKSTGKIILRNGASATIEHYKDLTIENDGTCTLKGTKL